MRDPNWPNENNPHSTDEPCPRPGEVDTSSGTPYEIPDGAGPED